MIHICYHVSTQKIGEILDFLQHNQVSHERLILQLHFCKFKTAITGSFKIQLRMLFFRTDAFFQNGFFFRAEVDQFLVLAGYTACRRVRRASDNGFLAGEIVGIASAFLRCRDGTSRWTRGMECR